MHQVDCRGSPGSTTQGVATGTDMVIMIIDDNGQSVIILAHEGPRGDCVGTFILVYSSTPGHVYGFACVTLAQASQHLPHLRNNWPVRMGITILLKHVFVTRD